MPKIRPENQRALRLYSLCKSGITSVNRDTAPAKLLDRLMLVDSQVNRLTVAKMRRTVNA